MKVFFAAIAILLAGAVFAAPVSFSADSVQSSLAKGKERTILSGRAKVKTGSVSMTSLTVRISA